MHWRWGQRNSRILYTSRPNRSVGERRGREGFSSRRLMCAPAPCSKSSRTSTSSLSPKDWTPRSHSSGLPGPVDCEARLHVQRRQVSSALFCRMASGPVASSSSMSKRSQLNFSGSLTWTEGPRQNPTIRATTARIYDVIELVYEEGRATIGGSYSLVYSGEEGAYGRDLYIFLFLHLFA